MDDDPLTPGNKSPKGFGRVFSAYLGGQDDQDVLRFGAAQAATIGSRSLRSLLGSTKDEELIPSIPEEPPAAATTGAFVHHVPTPLQPTMPLAPGQTPAPQLSECVPP